MKQYLAAAIETARLAAPEQAPQLEVSGTQGGALIIGVIIMAVIITKWRSQKDGLTPETKKMIALSIVATVCLYGGSGIFGSLFQTIRSTADQTGTTITQTGVGR